MSEKIDGVKQIISTLFSVPEESLTEDSSPTTVPGWDSMGQLMLVLELEQQFDLTISPEVGEKLTSIGAIASFLEA